MPTDLDPGKRELKRTQRTRPCHDCPFARHTKDGALGGGAPETYLGQILGPFWLPCHNSAGYEENRRDPTHEQCAGAAIFRANVGVDVMMPSALLHLPKGDPQVLTGPIEFLQHHCRMTDEQATAWLNAHPPDKMLRDELAKQEAQLMLLPRKP